MMSDPFFLAKFGHLFNLPGREIESWHIPGTLLWGARCSCGWEVNEAPRSEMDVERRIHVAVHRRQGQQVSA